VTAMPNLFAQIALYAWVPLGILFFRLFKPVTAATLTLLGASVILPANFAVNPPGLPPVDRHVASGIAALIGFFLFAPPETRRLRRLDWPVILILVLAISTFITTITNPDPLRYGDFALPALSAYDALGLVFHRGLTIGVPFLVGMRLVRSTEDVLSALRVIVILGLAYVPLVFWEARMSPQLHTTLYGYFPHDFIQHVRAGGFRPVVFTGSGLECALFMATTVIAAVGLAQAQVKIFGLPPILTVLALFVGLVSCISLGPLLYGLLVPALMLSTKVTVQARVSLVLSFVIVFYPLLRSQDLFPTEVFVSTAESVSKDRASSLNFRFRNEDLLLERARDRLLFGWGSWSRSHVFDASTGKDESVTDGYWIIELGSFGLVGFLSFFSLLLAPLVLSARRMRSLPPGRPRQVVAVLILLVLVRAIDLIPNGFLAPITLFLAGSLFWCAKKTTAASRSPAKPRPRPADGIRRMPSPARPADVRSPP
jgi:hypothetical protein